MKKNYHLDELEAFLADSADQHRMYPSDRVWRNIDKELHDQKKWPALTFGALLTGAVIVAGLILVHPSKNLLQIDPHQPGTTTVQADPASKANSSIYETSPQRSGASILAESTSPVNQHSQGSVSFHDFKEATNGADDFGASAASNMERSSAGDLLAIGSEGWEDSEMAGLNGIRNSGTNNAFPNVGTNIAPGEINVEEIPATAESASMPSTKSFVPNAAEEQASLPRINAEKLKNRWSMQYYFTPSYSYRYLTESKIVDLHQSQQAGPIASNLVNAVNNFVSHKPTLGLEAGAGVVYQASSKLELTAGLQMNMRGYTIDAFASGIQPSTVVLNRGFYNDSIFGLSSYSTQSGYKEVEIENRYWQISVPIGINYQVTNGKKLNLSITASVQPTYQLNNSEFILSHDYRNYLQQPDLVRRFNVNTSLGAMFNYEAANGLKWQVGPQIRYQALSGTISEYPIREHLLDYGLKIGVVKTLK